MDDPRAQLREHILEAKAWLAARQDDAYERSIDAASRDMDRLLAALAPVHKGELPDTYDMDVIRSTFEEALFDAFIGYASGGAVTKWRNAAGRAVLEAHSDAFYRGYEEAGAEETEPEDDAWLTKRQREQREFLTGVFAWIKEQRDAETVTEDAIRARVEAWAQALDATYGEGKLRGNKSQVLIWHLGETEDHCATCARLDGQRHKAKWYLDRDYIPGKAGAAMNCGGYRCGCFLTTKSGETVTL